MQVRRKRALEKRNRYYHSQMVMDVLESEEPYEKLPDTFVIFLCDFAPFGRKRYCYTFRNVCKEELAVELRDGSCTIFLNIKGKNETEVSPEMVRFLKFVTAGLAESEGDFQDELVQRFQAAIRKIKTDREIVLELLEDFGQVPDELQAQIEKLDSLENLKIVLKLAAKAESLGAFEEAATPYFISEENE